MSEFLFTPAKRQAVHLKLGIQGPAGSGKTDGALALATQLAAGGRVACVDTENRSSELYAHRYAFDILDLKPPYESKRYEAAIAAAIAGGAVVVIVDSLSHQWAGPGGILSRKEAADRDRRGGNTFTGWEPFTKEHEAFKAFLMSAPVHLIATLRTKHEYVIEEDGRGKKVPKRIGTKPIQREGIEYEFTAQLELQMSKRATSSKDRTELLHGELDLRDVALGQRLLAWTRGELGAAVAPTPAAAAPAPVVDAPAITRDTPFPGDRNGRMKGSTLKDWPIAQLRWAERVQASFFEDSQLNDAWLLAIRDELKARTAVKAS